MKSEQEYFEFTTYTKEKIASFTSIREGETKLGEKLTTDYKSPSCKYVIIGISEDLGPQANMGISGSKNSFKSFVNRFINTQSNRYLHGESICILGEIIQNTNFSTTTEARKSIEILDDFAAKILCPIFESGKTIILIGGGHNNAYPLLKANFTANKTSMNVVNMDPHADCRPLEGRHSGNPFSYAKDHGFLENYSVIGLHQNYNSERIYDYLDKNKFMYTFYEDYLDGNRILQEDIQTIINTRDHNKNVGIEIDLDSIAYMPSSAYTPSGFSLETIRQYVREIAKQKNISYIHLPEGGPSTANEEKTVGKALAYLVTDFIKSNNSY
jgi:formiminoglutamase